MTTTETEPRIAYPAFGWRKAMGYKYRARVVPATSWFRGRPGFRVILEYYHMAWDVEKRSGWARHREDAERLANQWLDSIERKPDGDYV